MWTSSSSHSLGSRPARWDTAAGSNTESPNTTLTRVVPRKVLIIANLQKDETEQDEVALDDDIILIYQQNLFQVEGTDPPWIKLPREAKAAINRENPLAGPPLVSAVDNCLYRQIYLYYCWQGKDHSDAINTVTQYKSDNKIRRKDLAKDVLDDISGTTLTAHNGPYFDKWDHFQTFLQQRHNIIYPTDGSVPVIDTEIAVDWFNLTVDLILGHLTLSDDTRNSAIVKVQSHEIDIKDDVHSHSFVELRNDRVVRANEPKTRGYASDSASVRWDASPARCSSKNSAKAGSRRFSRKVLMEMEYVPAATL